MTEEACGWMRPEQASSGLFPWNWDDDGAADDDDEEEEPFRE
jgi:hypothetical protein